MHRPVEKLQSVLIVKVGRLFLQHHGVVDPEICSALRADVRNVLRSMTVEQRVALRDSVASNLTYHLEPADQACVRSNLVTWFGRFVEGYLCSETYYMIDGCGDLTKFDTLAEARNECEAALEVLTDEAADGGWDEGSVLQLEYGKLIQMAEIHQGPSRPSDNPEFSYICDYILKDIQVPADDIQLTVSKLRRAIKQALSFYEADDDKSCAAVLRDALESTHG